MSGVRPGRHLCDPVLETLGVAHGFAERGAQVPESTVFARQVHGIAVVRGEALRADGPCEADAVVSTTPGLAVGVVTASWPIGSRCRRRCGGGQPQPSVPRTAPEAVAP